MLLGSLRADASKHAHLAAGLGARVQRRGGASWLGPLIGDAALGQLPLQAEVWDWPPPAIAATAITAAPLRPETTAPST